ncbi:hypothetical protein PALA111701_30310 [Paenibacillus lactis]
MKRIVSDGYMINKVRANFSSIAFITLRRAIFSYFSSYMSAQNQLHFSINNTFVDQEEIDWNYGNDYVESYTETILHFQHFIELICKEILLKKHELLAMDAEKKPIVLYKLLMGEEISDDDIQGIKTTEFSVVIKRLYDLIDVGVIDSKFAFFKDHKDTIRELNSLRNRITHRGTFILRYEALDVFVGRYILPLILEIVNLNQHLQPVWRYNELACGIDPLKEIIDELKKVEGYNLRKVAFLKELGRAAYKNPIIHQKEGKWFEFFEKPRIRKAEANAESYLTEPFEQAVNVSECPVCGCKTLVTYEESDGDQNDDGSYNEYWTFSSSVECFFCSFEAKPHIGNPKDYGFSWSDLFYEIKH